MIVDTRPVCGIDGCMNVRRQWASACSKHYCLAREDGSYVPHARPNKGIEPAWVKPLESWSAFMRLRDLSPQSIEKRNSDMRRFARETGVHPYEATLDDLTIYLDQHSNWKPETTAANRSSLMMFYRWAYQTKKMPDDVGLNLPRPRFSSGQPKPVTEEEYLEALHKCSDPRLHLALRLAGELGMRRAEVAQINENDLKPTPDGYLLEIIGKGRKRRVIPMPAGLADELLEHIRKYGNEGYAFPSQHGGHLSAHWIGDLVSSVLPEGYTMHKLRHRALTQAYRRSKDILLTAKLAGHSTIATTQRYYVAVDYGELRTLVEGLGS